MSREEPLIPGDERFADEEEVELLNLEPPSVTAGPHPRVGLALYSTYIVVYLLALAIVRVDRETLTRAIGVSNVVLLILTAALQNYLSWYHERRRKQGYLNFYVRMRGLCTLPSAIVSFGTAIILLVSLWPNVAFEFGPHFPLTAGLLLRVAAGLQLLALLPLLWVYRGLAEAQLRGPAIAVPPDARETLLAALHHPPAQPHAAGTERPAQWPHLNLLEQQAELIQFQHERLRQLSKEVLRLEEALTAAQTPPQESEEARRNLEVDRDVAEKREQELRETQDKLLSQLMEARSLIEEKDTSIQRLQHVNQQYSDENNRLRAMLDEWSARNAKMERALDVERKRHQKG